MFQAFFAVFLVLGALIVIIRNPSRASASVRQLERSRLQREDSRSDVKDASSRVPPVETDGRLPGEDTLPVLSMETPLVDISDALPPASVPVAIPFVSKGNDTEAVPEGIGHSVRTLEELPSMMDTEVVGEEEPLDDEELIIREQLLHPWE